MTYCKIIQSNNGNLLFDYPLLLHNNYHICINPIIAPCHLQLGQKKRHILKLKMYLFALDLPSVPSL